MRDVEKIIEKLEINPEDYDLETDKRIIDAYINAIKYLEDKRLDKWSIIQEFQYKFDKFIDKIRNIDRSVNPECWVMTNALAIVQEVSELVDGLDWKHWKNSNVKINREYMLEELADILHFYISMLISAGVDVNNIKTNKDVMKLVDKYCSGSIDGCKIGDPEILKTILLSFELSLNSMNVFKLYFANHQFFKEQECSFDVEVISNLFSNLKMYILLVLQNLGYTFDDLYYAYLRKNLKNFLRQVSPKFRGGSYYAGDVVKEAVDVIKNTWYKI